MNTKENIMQTALVLFANRGYEAVSVADIASELDLTKGALYRHYKSKRDILDSIVERIELEDRKRASIYKIPDIRYEQNPKAYSELSIEGIISYGRNELAYWTKNEFASSFRRMLTIEQYSDKELEKVYRKYILQDVLVYIEGGFKALGYSDKSKYMALEFYAPYFTLLNLYDTAENKDEIELLFEQHSRDFYERYKK